MDKKQWITPLIKHVWTVSAIQITLLGVGMSISYPSSLLPGLRDPGSTIKVDLHTASWLVSSVGISSTPGYFLVSFLMYHYGRRIAFAITLLPAILGWFLIYFAPNIGTLMAGRLLNGLTVGGGNFLGAVAIGEYISPQYRGMFLNLKTAFFSLGCLLVHILANYILWRTIALISLILNVVPLLIILTWPESPAWLASNKEFKKCESAFVWLRGSSEQANKELDELIKAQMEKESGIKTKSSVVDKVVQFFNKFKRTDFQKPMLIIFFSISLMELCGRHIFPAYALDIIGEITGNKSQSFFYVIVLDIISTVSTFFSAVLAKLMSRRRLLFVTGWAAVAVLTIFCCYLFLAPVEIRNNDKNSWIPICMIIIYFTFASLGCTPIPLAILGEIIPLSHRAAGTAVGGIILSSCLYGTLQMTPYLMASVKVRGTFAVLGAGMALCLLILYFILPETKDRTLQEIDDFFTYGQYTVDRTIDDDNKEKHKMLDR